MERRVVVTGMGAITPIGNNVETFWNNVKAGVLGIDEITKFDTTDYSAKLAAEHLFRPFPSDIPADRFLF